MISNIKFTLTTWLHVLLFLVVPCLAREKQVCRVSIAALNLPGNSDGLLHWRVGDVPTTPLQLSTRYFFECVKLEHNIIQFYKDPILAVPIKEPAPKPLITLTIPEDQKLVYAVLWTESDGGDAVKWRSMVLNGKDWISSSLKVVSTCNEKIGIIAGSKNIMLAPGQSIDFTTVDWSDSFPVRMFQFAPEQNLVFSSKWRVTAGRREICFLGKINGGIQLRSLIELNNPADSKNGNLISAE